MSKISAANAYALNAKVAEVLGLPEVIDFVNNEEAAQKLMADEKVLPMKSSPRVAFPYVIVVPYGTTIYVADYADMDETFRVAICMAVLEKHNVAY